MRAVHNRDRATPEIRYRREIRTYPRSGPHPANAMPASPHIVATTSADPRRVHNFRLSEKPRPLPASAEALSNPESHDELKSADPLQATASAPLFRAVHE